MQRSEFWIRNFRYQRMDYGGYFAQQGSGIDGSVTNPFQLNTNFNLNNSAGYSNGAQTQIYGQYTNPYLTGNRSSSYAALYYCRLFLCYLVITWKNIPSIFWFKKAWRCWRTLSLGLISATSLQIPTNYFSNSAECLSPEYSRLDSSVLQHR